MAVKNSICKTFGIFFLGILLNACSGGGGASSETQASLPVNETNLTVSGSVYGVASSSGTNGSVTALHASRPLEAGTDGCLFSTTAVCYVPMLELVTVVVIPAFCANLSTVQDCETINQSDYDQELEEIEQQQEIEELQQAKKIFVASAETDEEGKFELDVKSAGRALVDGGLVFVFGESGVQKVMWGDTDEEGEVELQVGDVDMDSTVATESFQTYTQADLEKYAEEKGGIASDFDVDCLLKLGEEQNKQVLNAEGAGVAASVTVIQLLTSAAIIANDAASFGYDSQSELLAAITNGELADEALQTLAAAAQANVLGANADALVEAYPFAVQDNKVLTGLYAATFAQDEGDDDPCDKMDGDSEVLSETVSIALSSDDVQSFVSTFGSTGAVAALFDFMAQYSDGNGNYDFDGDEGVCSTCPVWNPTVTGGFFDAYQQIHGEFSDFSSSLDAFGQMLTYVPQNVSGTFDYGDWATAMMGQYLNDADTFDPSAAAGFWAVQLESGLDLDDGTINVASFDYDGVYQTMATTYASTYSSCYANPAACASDLDSSQIQIAGVTYQDYSSTAACGNGTCESGENSSCYVDCGYSSSAASSSYYSAVCGDQTCEGYESYSCPQDCTSSSTDSGSSGTSGTSSGYCGDGTCSGTETQATCVSDCDSTSGASGTSTTFCGDGACNGSETEATCSTDCHTTAGTSDTYTYCGDFTCNGIETSSSCPVDCYSSGSSSTDPVCGDQQCTGYETIYTCYADCYSGSSSSYCGDNVCNGNENYGTCTIDCD